MTRSVDRREVLAFRVRAQQLDRVEGTLPDTAVLDLGVQDTGPDGALWALQVRGVDVSAVGADQLATVWTIRGAPHVYRRDDLPFVATAVEPFSEADAGKRIFDATKPLKAAGITNLQGLDTVAATMRQVVTAPMVKGDVSRQVSDRLDEAYLRFCRPCDAVHIYEMPFRLGALRAGLELQAGTSPPVLEPIPDFAPAPDVPARLDVVRAYLRLLGPATPKQVAGYLDAPVKDVQARWPQDVVEVSVAGETRWLLTEDEDLLGAGPARTTRLLGPYDLFLQAKDRGLLVDDPAHAKALWPVLGRPGAVFVDGEIAGTWRARKSGRTVSLTVDLWGSAAPEDVEEQAGRLASFRGLRLGSVALT